MHFAKSFIQRTPLNHSYIFKSTEILPLQYYILASKYTQSGPVRVPHSYSNKHDRIKMRNTLEVLHELFRHIKK